MTRIITGIQPTGKITLGNYIGSIKQIVKYQEMYETFIFIADLHAITNIHDINNLKENTRSLIALYLACGVDPNKCTIFLQSENEYHTNLSWLLECSSYYGELSRMIQFKEKSHENANFSVGLLTYPVLMASDILLYDADYVPVGIDQKQHVELTRNIAERFNNKFGNTFKVPDVLINEHGAKIMDLQEPTKKMSKSSDNPKGVIYLLDSKEDIVKKIMSATTDSEMLVKYDPENKPGISNLISIYSSLTNLSIKEIENKFIGYNYGEFKKEVANVCAEEMSKIGKRYQDIINSDLINKVLNDGINKVRPIAKEKYLMAKRNMGFFE